MKYQRIIITPGEPAGIGPDIIIQTAQQSWPVELVVCADKSMLQDRAVMLNLPLKLMPYNASNNPIPQKSGTLTLLPISLYEPAIPGQLNIRNSRYVIETLKRACDGCLNKEFTALVTGPVHKGIINKAGINFTGHTDFLKERSHSQTAVMMLMIEEMRVALVTNHLPIKMVPNVITRKLLYNSINVLHNNLRNKFGISNPHILVCGLNPHAGESGYIGSEEINIISPTIKEMQLKGINLDGPLPADTVFQLKYLNNADAVLAMYHDQGLPVLKYQGFGRGINVTLGLPFIRTSVDHGTALDLVNRRKVNIGSFTMALNLAIKMAINP